MWTVQQIEDHIKAGRLLSLILKKSIKYIQSQPDITEYKLQQFVIQQFKFYNLVLDQDVPIVAFRQSTAYVHYFPIKKSLILRPETLIMIDIFARLNIPSAPYSDITWIYHYGNNIPNKIKQKFSLVIKTRDKTMDFLRSKLAKKMIPTGQAIDDVARKIISAAGVGDNFLHTTGHSLGINHVHGPQAGINQKNPNRLEKNIGYTVEPGVYFKHEFGIRSEIDFYINSNYELVITTPIQIRLSKIKIPTRK